MLAIIEAYKNKLLQIKNWPTNIIAGIVVGIVALPLAMAFAIASGLKPEQGLYTAIIAGALVAIFGGTRVQIAGPTGAFVVILASITAKYGITGLQIATIMAGIILIIMGMLKLGTAIKFIPYPVIVGFTSGIGVIIFVNAWKDFFGLKVHVPLDSHFHEKLFLFIQAFPSLDLITTGLAVISLLIIIFAPKIIRWIPGPLLAMVLITAAVIGFKFASVATIGSVFGAIPQQLPCFQLPNFSELSFMQLISPAFTIALLSGIESLLSATAADSIMGTKHNANQELIGHGLANIIAPFWGGFASTGAIARTVTNIRYGGNSPIAAIIHSLVLILIILVLAPLASYIPFCALAAILFVVAYNMSDIPEFMHIAAHAPYYDKVTLLITFLLTIFVDLVIAVAVGTILAMLFFTLRMYQSTMVVSETKPECGSEDVMIYHINGPFFFGAAEKIEQALAATHTDPKAIIFSFRHVPFIDITGLETLKKMLEQYQKRGVNVYFCEANQIISKKLSSLNIIELTKSRRIFASVSHALEYYQVHK